MIRNIFGSLEMKKNESEFSSDIANIMGLIPDVLEVPLEMCDDSDIGWIPTPTATPQRASDSLYHSAQNHKELPASMPLAVYGSNGKMTRNIKDISEMVDVKQYDRMLYQSRRDSNLNVASILRFEHVCTQAVIQCGHLLDFIDNYISAVPHFPSGMLISSDLEKIIHLKNMATMVQKTGLAIVGKGKNHTRMSLVMPNHVNGIVYMGKGKYSMIESIAQNEKPGTMLSLMMELLMKKNQMVKESRFFPVPADFTFSFLIKKKKRESLKKMNELEKQILWMTNTR